MVFAPKYQYQLVLCLDLILCHQKLIIDAKINGDIKSDEVETFSNSNIKGNIKSKKASIGGTLKGNINSDRINIKKTADIDGVLNQKTLSIEEGAQLKIKTETYK